MQATEERKLVTVLFADIVGSTALASEQDPERVRALMDRFYDAMQAEVAAAGGTVEKFAGDAVLASFGAPTAQEDHAERALHTALSMCRRVEELFGDRLAIRVGVNTGEVVVGPARVGGAFLTGDAVNVAARLEQAAAAGEILVGERTVAVVRGAFEFEERKTVEAKGKPGGVGCCRLVRGITLMRPRGIGGREAVFVGRQSELELLQATYRRAFSQAEPHLVTIMGDPGVGKTRLVRELWGWLAGEGPPQPLQRTGRCLPYGQITYWALGEVLKEHLGIREDDSPEQVRERLGQREILGLALGLDIAGDLHPLAARDRLHEAWVSFLEELVADRPAVVLFEDLHWAEEPLLDLLERTARDVRGPLFLLATARPDLLDLRPTWGGGRRNASLLGIEPLSEEETALLADELLASRVSGNLRTAIVERAEGNPFFVEELVAALSERGEFQLPDSVQALLAARIDLLPATEKAGLQAAAVIGRIFWTGPVGELLGGDEPDWELLEDRDFVRRRPGSSISGESEYAIKHALTREVAYGSLPKAKRARLHARFAEWLERFGEGRDEHAALLAHHYAEAARPEDADLAWAGADAELDRLRRKGIDWLRRAGALAIGRYEIDEGLAFLHRALELGPEEAERTAIWREIGRSNALKFDGQAFWEAMQESLKSCTDPATCGETYSLLAFYTAHRSGMWKRRPERELVDGWIEKALDLVEPGSEAHVRTLVAQAYWHPDSEEAVAREASALADRLGNLELRSYAWLARSAAAFSAGRYQEAFDWAQRRFDLWDEIDDPDHAVEMLEEALPTIAALGRFNEARRLAWDYVERASRLTTHHRVHGISMVVEVEEAVGAWESIQKVTADVQRAVSENLATPCVRNARSLLVCAAASQYRGDEAGAAALERTADDLGIEVATRLAGPRIRLALARRDLDTIRRLVEEMEPAGRLTFGLLSASARFDALSILRVREQVEAEAPSFLHRGTYLEPFALRALGIVREDEKLLQQALAAFEALGLEWHAAQTEALVQEA